MYTRRANLFVAAMMAVAGIGISGAQRPGNSKGAIVPTEYAPRDDLMSAPLRFFGGGRRSRSTNTRKPHCGAKQCAKYAKQDNAKWNINRHYDRRMQWNEEVLPRVEQLRRRKAA